MDLPQDFRITTELLLQSALVFAILDLILAAILVWRIKPQTFRQLKWELLAVTALFWCGLWFWVIVNFWETVYRLVFPGWAHWLMPFFQAALTTVVAALAWRLSLRFRAHPLIAYLLFGGLWGMVSHLWAVSRGIVDRPSMLQGASPVSAVIIAIFEFIFYWCIICAAAALIHDARKSEKFRRLWKAAPHAKAGSEDGGLD
jgi:hypothetical protein